jgi:tetratricopeptide (TPR) repeat protein
MAVIGVLAVSGAAATVARNPVWHDDARLAAATLRAEPRAWHMHVILGNYYEREGKLEKALEAYEEGLRNFPDKPQISAAVINVRLKLHRIGPDEAIRSYLPLARAYPSLYEVQFNLGDAYLKAGRPVDAEEAFRRAAEINPSGTQAREGLTLALVAQGRPPEEAGADDVSLPPAARSRALVVQAVAGLEAGRLDEAESLLRKALELDPRSHRAYLSLAVLESRRGNDTAAMDDCRKALALRPDFAAAYGQMGVSALRLGDLGEATRDLEQATRLDPRDKEGLSRLGVIYAQTGRLEEAKAAFRQALALDPGFAKARHNLSHLEELEREDAK